LLNSDGTANGADDAGLLDFNGTSDGNTEGLLDFDGTKDDMDKGSLDSYGISKASSTGCWTEMVQPTASLTLMAQRMAWMTCHLAG
jgi:hypothetical protein